MMAKQFLSVIFFLLISQSLSARVYKCENDAGDINFSDEPCARGETTEQLDWLKGATGKKPQKKKPSHQSSSSQAKRVAQKARKNNQAYVLLSLLTTTQLELETATLRSSLDGELSEAPELLLADGITVDFLKLDKIIITYRLGDDSLKVRFIMADGYEEVKILQPPYPVISGAARIGSFRKSLQDIKQIQFFNSAKLLAQAQRKSAASKTKKHVSSQTKKLKASSSKIPVRKEKSPVVELDLTYQLSESEKKKAMSASQPHASHSKKPVIKVIDRSGANKMSAVRSAKHLSAIQVNFVNDNKVNLQREQLASSKGKLKSRPNHFILSDKLQIPYNDISSIKIRPASQQLLVAVKLKSKEIKMEAMTSPFTRITGNSSSGKKFDYSLLEIKAINF